AKTQRNVGDTVENLRNAITAGGCEDAYYELGRLYVDLAKFDKATECLQGYLDKAPLGVHAREVREMLATAAQWQTMMGPESGDTSTKLARWVEEARGLPPPEIYQTLSMGAAAVAYLCACIKGIPQKEQVFAQRIETIVGAVSQFALQPSGDAGTDKATRNQYFDYFGQLYMIPAATDAAEMLRSIAAGSQPKSTQAAASQRVTEDLKKRMTQEATQLGRLKAITRAWVEYLQISVQSQEKAGREKAKLDAIGSQYEVQRTLCANALQEVCNDFYMCAQLTGVLIDFTDASGVHRERATELLEQMEMADREVETCDQQIGVGATALVQLLSIVASDRSLAPR
ncbi:MAG: hypothetical protein RDV41_01405, partial [Planctomycetota bacterium]|nr:hypothetical protein [Planctomycetota bacterium]